VFVHLNHVYTQEELKRRALAVMTRRLEDLQDMCPRICVDVMVGT
jgi:hypothetical protein